MIDWQPIETAPKDGTHVLLCCATNADGNPIKAENFGLFVTRAAWWGDEGYRGEWVCYCSLPNEPVVFFDPTHWAPIGANPLSGESDDA